ncbi:hypothetical protein N8I77_001906 [Diaporthe amygdali]|uniref:Uncharacterized protein n=1 Tax=Phomopsis amygdali TaxID=1214568 RepID=A0AAD9SRL5_PHOAM|nr:hypothetical protein N8I77_001906 [Diaporthe amygdali]
MASQTQQALIISAWPCAGKTTFAQTRTGHTVVDLDSSGYDLKSPAGTIKYIDDIQDTARGSPGAIVLVSSHGEVRQLLKQRGLKYVAVSIHELEDWKERQKGRVREENDLAQLGLLKKGIAEWDSWKQSQAGEESHVVLKRQQYLGSPDVIAEILKLGGVKSS